MLNFLAEFRNALTFLTWAELYFMDSFPFQICFRLWVAFLHWIVHMLDLFILPVDGSKHMERREMQPYLHALICSSVPGLPVWQGYDEFSWNYSLPKRESASGVWNSQLGKLYPPYFFSPLEWEWEKKSSVVVAASSICANICLEINCLSSLWSKVHRHQAQKN